MEGSGSSRFVRPRPRNSNSKRRYWTNAEELALIASVKELIADGWRAGNGWKCGFYKQVEKRIHSIIPGCDLKGEPHVHSKLTVWKREYNLVSGLFGKSGEGLDPRDHTINIVGTKTWESNVKLNPDLEKMRGKSFPFFSEWCEMFGKDRANGDDAEDAGAAVEDILNNQQTRGVEENADPLPDFDFTLPTDYMAELEDDNVSNSALSKVANPTATGGTPKPTSLKRKQCAQDDPLVGMVGVLCTKTEEAMIELSQAIRALKEVDPNVMKIYAAIESLPGFTVDNRVVAAKKIVESPTGVALFFTMGTEAQSSFVRNVLSGDM